MLIIPSGICLHLSWIIDFLVNKNVGWTSFKIEDDKPSRCVPQWKYNKSLVTSILFLYEIWWMWEKASADIFENDFEGLLTALVDNSRNVLFSINKCPN